MAKKIVLEPIGYVENDIERAIHPHKSKNKVSKIILYPKLTKGLKGIEEFSHLYIICWMSEVSFEERGVLTVVFPNPQKPNQRVGVFTTRVPFRYNPISLTLVELIKREKNTLVVRGLDMYNNTPVLDIKPYTSSPRDTVSLGSDLRVAPWIGVCPVEWV